VLRLRTWAAELLLPLNVFTELIGRTLYLLIRFGPIIVQGVRRRQKSIYPIDNRAANDQAYGLDKIMPRFKG
jgi:hypothetical protein